MISAELSLLKQIHMALHRHAHVLIEHHRRALQMLRKGRHPIRRTTQKACSLTQCRAVRDRHSQTGACSKLVSCQLKLGDCSPVAFVRQRISAATCESLLGGISLVLGASTSGASSHASVLVGLVLLVGLSAGQVLLDLHTTIICQASAPHVSIHCARGTSMAEFAHA